MRIQLTTVVMRTNFLAVRKGFTAESVFLQLAHCWGVHCRHRDICMQNNQDVCQIRSMVMNVAVAWPINMFQCTWA